MTDTDDDDLLLENLTPATIHQIAWEVADKTHDPKDAKRLLWKYIDLVDKEEVFSGSDTTTHEPTHTEPSV